MQTQFNVCYLLHFDQPIGNAANPHGQAQHYLGHADHLGRRIEQHLKGQGAKITQALVRMGIGFQIAQTWPGDRWFERQLKNRKNARALCPICQAQARAQQPLAQVDDLI